jgi:hypothetical protein
MAVVMAFFTGVDRFVKAEEEVAIEECACELSSWKNFEISCCGVMKNKEDFEKRMMMKFFV